jgi:hypothetical protein
VRKVLADDNFIVAFLVQEGVIVGGGHPRVEVGTAQRIQMRILR